MRHFRLKKKSEGGGRKMFVPQGVRTTAPKPRLPRVVVWDAHPPATPPRKEPMS